MFRPADALFVFPLVLLTRANLSLFFGISLLSIIFHFSQDSLCSCLISILLLTTRRSTSLFLTTDFPVFHTAGAFLFFPVFFTVIPLALPLSLSCTCFPFFSFLSFLSAFLSFFVLSLIICHILVRSFPHVSTGARPCVPHTDRTATFRPAQFSRPSVCFTATLCCPALQRRTTFWLT